MSTQQVQLGWPSPVIPDTSPVNTNGEAVSTQSCGIGLAGLGSNNLPVSTSNRAVLPESRSVRISGLSSKVSQTKLQGILGKIGPLEACEIGKGAPGTTERHATARLTSKEAAAVAVNKWPETLLKRKCTSVGFDPGTDEKTAHEPNIIIANGS
ncbi:hypothetical protein MBLNU459_g4877t1 [Dothideomycetes sp. NU459]